MRPRLESLALEVYLFFSRTMHVVLPWSWPSHESGLPPTGTRAYGLEATFLCYRSELLRSKASSRCRPLHGLSYPWASGGNTIDISAWRCLSWAMPLLGDVFLGRCLCLAISDHLIFNYLTHWRHTKRRQPIMYAAERHFHKRRLCCLPDHPPFSCPRHHTR